MNIRKNIPHQSQCQTSFGGAGRATRNMIEQIYPYCALTGKKYGMGELRITTDHIRPRCNGGANKDSNFLFVTKEINAKKGSECLRKVISTCPEYVDNLVNYFESLLNSQSEKALRYAKVARETVIKELSGMHSNLADRKLIV